MGVNYDHHRFGVELDACLHAALYHFYAVAIVRHRVAAFNQFFYHDFPKTHQTTTHRKIYKNCLVCDACIRELMVLDVPPQEQQQNNLPQPDRLLTTSEMAKTVGPKSMRYAFRALSK
ncbi:hypothetical protein ACLKA6_014941 [Drosophila palustris]